MQFNFIQIVDSIFKNKKNFNNIPDEDKDVNFFIINRKFSVKYPLLCNSLNSKFINKCNSVDFWSIFFNNTTNIPNWYWAKKKEKEKTSATITNTDKKLLITYLNLKPYDLDFLIKHDLKSVKSELKSIKNFTK